MKHESLNVKKFTVKEDKGFRIRVESWEATAPKDLIAVDFIQECLNKDGEVDFTSTYSYNMTREEIANLCKGLLQI
jgi:hypothetical protein